MPSCHAILGCRRIAVLGAPLAEYLVAATGWWIGSGASRVSCVHQLRRLSHDVLSRARCCAQGWCHQHHGRAATCLTLMLVVAFAHMAIPSLVMTGRRPSATARLIAPACALRADDDPLDLRFAAEWALVSQDLDATCTFSRPSAVSEDTLIEIYEHNDGWRTLRFVDVDPMLRKHVQWTQSAVRFAEDGFTREGRAIALEYQKSMCAVALATTASSGTDLPQRMLVLGL
eukprot:2184826-Prymnesium_polylepis.1